MMHPLYVHVPLYKPTEQIRLLKWQPPDKSLPSEEMPHYNLSTYDCAGSWPEYIGISYTWGDSIPMLPISINGHVVPVRMHCWHALWQLRHHQIEHNLWIDSICINQADDTEKSAQVAMMAKIYGNARSVAACIGTGNTLDRLRESVEKQDEQLAHDVFSELEHLPYFDRLWVKQEIILPREVSLFCGPNKVSWNNLDALRAILPATVNPKYGKVIAACINRTSKRQDQPISNSCLGLIQLLHTYGSSRCMDSRDKVYALLSLLPEDDPGREITPDYGISTFTLFKRVFLFCCQQSGSFYESSALPVLHDLLGWLHVDLHGTEVSELIQQRRQALIKTPSTKLTTRSMYINLPISGVARFTNAPDDVWGVLENDISLGSYAVLDPHKTSMKTASQHKAHHEALTTPECPGAIFAAARLLPPHLSASYSQFSYYICLFLVGQETRADDIFARIEWTNVLDGGKPLVSYAVLRKRDPDSSSYGLCSWAILVEESKLYRRIDLRRCLMLPKRQYIPPETSYRLTEAVELEHHSEFSGITILNNRPYLRLHYEDVLAFMLQRRQGPSIGDVATTPANLSHAVLSHEDEAGLNGAAYTFATKSTYGVIWRERGTGAEGRLGQAAIR